MEKTQHIYIGDMGALEFAQKIGLKVMPEAYFITDHAFEMYTETLKEASNTIEEAGDYQVKRKTHGTVGAVALDKEGNIAAATTTGGTENKVPGRIGDSSMIGVGTFANNYTCAVSGTGDGEALIQNVIGFHLSSILQYKGMPLKEAAHYLIHQELKDAEGDSGTMMNGGSAERGNRKGEVHVSIGLGFINELIIDTHFDARGRFDRLAQAIAMQPGIIGVGLGEDTGIIIEKGQYLKAIGSSTVTIIDGKHISYNNITELKKCMPYSLAKLEVFLLTHSDCYDIDKREFKPTKFDKMEE
jgi:hypothetical protein